MITEKEYRRVRRRALAIEAGLWLAVAALAVAWTLLIQPGTKLRATEPKPAQFECSEWAPANDPTNVTRHCRRIDQ
jgi:hypothetical protein